MGSDDRTREQLLRELEEKESRISELEDTLAEAGRRGQAVGDGLPCGGGVQKDSGSALAPPPSFFQMILDKANDVSLIVQEGKYVYVNDKFAQLFGGSREEAVQRPFGAFIHPDDRPMVMEYHRLRREGKPAPAVYEVRLRMQDGSVMHGEVSAIDIEYEGRKASLAFIRDITVRKRIETELRESRDQFNRVMDSVSDIIIVLDARGNVTFESPSTARILGYPPGHFIGGSPFPLIHEEDVESVLAEFAEVIRRENTGVPTEFRIRKANGSWIWLAAVGNNLAESPGIQGMVITARDVTEKRRMEDSLRESESRFRDLAELLPQVVYEMDERGVFTFMNRFGLSLFGYSEEELAAGIHFLNIIAPTDHGRVSENVALAMKGDLTQTRSEYTAIRKNGEEFPLFVSSSFIQKEEGILGIRGVAIDFSEIRRSQRLLQESEERWQFALEGAGDGLWDWNVQTNRVLYSRQWKAMLGYGEDEIGDSLDEWERLLHPDDQARAHEELDRHFRGETPVYTCEQRLLCKDGSYKWILDRGRVMIWTPDGKPLRAIGTHTDIDDRKRMDEALLESESKFRDLAEKSVVGIYLVQDNTFQYINAEFARIIGYEAGQVTGVLLVDDVIHPEDLPLVKNMLARRLSGELKSLRYDFRVSRKDGDIRHVEVFSSRTMYRGQPAVIGTMLDITERKDAERKLRDSEEKYRVLFEHANDAIIIWDEEQFIDCNRKALEMFGFPSKEDIVGRPFTLSSPPRQPDGRPSIEAAREKRDAAMSGEPQFYEWQHCRPDGTIIEAETALHAIELQGQVYFQAIIRDVTERKRSEEALQRLSLALEQAAEEIIITDPEGVIQYVNPAFEKITGYSRHEAIGQTPRLVKSGVHDRAFYERLWSTIKRGSIWTGRITNRHKRGMLIQEDATISPIISSSGRVTGFISLKRDITEEVRLESKLRQAQKMEAIGTLAGGIAHDFNNILGAMMGYTELARLKAGEPQIRSYLDQVLKACNRSRDLVNQILTFSRQKEQEKKPVAVAPIVKEAMKLMRSSCPSTVEIRQNYGTEKDIILADPTQIHQVVMNLCTNAIHAMRDREGILAVSLGQKEITVYDPFYDSELREGPYVMLTVSDTGQGIDASVRNRIFDPFFTTKVPGEGTGLGLSVVYGIVKDHGGSISVESEPGKGSVFTVSLPLVEADEPGAGRDAEPPPRGKGRILLVDDEEPLAALGQEMLTSLGYDVSVRLSSLDALEAFRTNPARFNLVITDMTMPNMTGDHLAREMLKIRPDLPIILTTGFSERISEEEAKKLGIRVFVMKPVSLKALAQAVQTALQ
ncbi:MAG: PAS domain S-box protein [Syntrophaceae bacterium]|nr:PAS domain S-box protein [Syntrophaceae bacterium]